MRGAFDGDGFVVHFAAAVPPPNLVGETRQKLRGRSPTAERAEPLWQPQLHVPLGMTKKSGSMWRADTLYTGSFMSFLVSPFILHPSSQFFSNIVHCCEISLLLCLGNLGIPRFNPRCLFSFRTLDTAKREGVCLAIVKSTELDTWTMMIT